MTSPATRPDALILFAHGARDARWARTLAALAERIRAREPALQVSQAFLEFQTPDLPTALAAALAGGATRIEIAPVFWASGGHVANDVPPLLEAFRAQHAQVTLTMRPVLSELPGMLDFIADALLTPPR